MRTQPGAKEALSTQSKYHPVVIKEKPKNHGTQSLHPNILLRGKNRSEAQWESKKLSREDEQKSPSGRGAQHREPSGSPQQGSARDQWRAETLQRPRPLGEGWDRINGDNNSVTEVQKEINPGEYPL